MRGWHSSVTSWSVLHQMTEYVCCTAAHVQAILYQYTKDKLSDQLMTRPHLHTTDVMALGYRDDLKYLLSCCTDGTVRVSAYSDGTALATCKVNGINNLWYVAAFLLLTTKC